MNKILIANRGEIARRVIQTCQKLGFQSVAVFSAADAELPYVREADQAVYLGAPAPDTSYLNVEAILSAAKRTGADAVHPGYGFLAENADFAQAVLDAGLIWVGPSPTAISAMGDKAAARRLAVEHDVPVLQGFDEPNASDEQLIQAAERIGYPLLIKATAGGGGRGMRVVTAPEHLATEIASARREAESAFGNGNVLLERYITNPRHIEVQLMGDQHGNLCHLFERECSIQRRHQKIIEEAPSPGVSSEQRMALGAAAVRIAKAADYEGAGTAEFLMDDTGEFFFLEMNTRLQVEHPVTECVTGLDLVELQLRVAMGEPLPFQQEDLVLSGHAIEARVYAEDPLRDYAAGTGVLRRFDLPVSEGVRVDAGYEAGNEVGIYYDAMVAKVISFGSDRKVASRRLLRALERSWIPGVITNLPLLREILAHSMWLNAELTTGFLGKSGLPTPPPANAEIGLLAGVAYMTAALQQGQRFPSDVPLGWRVEGAFAQRDTWLCAGEEWAVEWRSSGAELRVRLVCGEREPIERRLRVRGRNGDAFDVEVDGLCETWRILKVGSSSDQLQDGDTLYAHTGQLESFVALKPRFPSPSDQADEPGSCTAPTPGTVVAVHVAVGDTVEPGQALVTLEAMKMEHRVTAPNAGDVEQLRVEVGDTVDEGELLVQLSVEDDE